jgi:hypothetical protein
MKPHESKLFKLRALSLEVEQLRVLVLATKDPELVEQMGVVLVALFSVTIEVELEFSLASSAA